MKKIVSFIIITVLVLVCATVYADVIIYTDSSFDAIPGSTVKIPVIIEGDIGLSCLKLSLDADTSVLSVTSANNGDVLTEKSFFAGNLNKMPHSSAWVDNDKIDGNGFLVEFSLTVNDTISDGDYPVKLFVNSGDALDMDGNVVEIPDFEFIMHVSGEPKKVYKGSMANFKKVRNYDDDFYDVIEDDWYYDAVKGTYEFGLTEDGGAFNAFDKLTVSDANKLIIKILSVYNEKEYNYKAIEILENIDKPISRASFVGLISNVLPSDFFEKINLSVTIPDVDESNEYYNDIYKLYAAGICVGGDENGCFYPDNTIERCEAIALINRLCNIENRVKTK